MLKGYKYNQTMRKINNKSIYEQEFSLLHDFLATDKENIRFEYSNEREAINARQAIFSCAKKARQPITVAQRGKYVFAVKKAEEKAGQ